MNTEGMPRQLDASLTEGAAAGLRKSNGFALPRKAAEKP
jgi:hypothetical protein